MAPLKKKKKQTRFSITEKEKIVLFMGNEGPLRILDE